MEIKNLGRLAWRLGAAFRKRQDALKSFEQSIQAAGGLAGRHDAGLRTVELRSIIGSVGRAQSLGPDFLPRQGRALTQRHERVGQAMAAGRALPPLELYAVVHPSPDASRSVSEYFVLDGHHRVAMARRIGQEFLEAHVVEYRLAVA